MHTRRCFAINHHFLGEGALERTNLCTKRLRL
jgi:hypothetical protein